MLAAYAIRWGNDGMLRLWSARSQVTGFGGWAVEIGATSPEFIDLSGSRNVLLDNVKKSELAGGMEIGERPVCPRINDGMLAL